MAKRFVQTVASDGTVVKRQTDRQYSHAVLVDGNRYREVDTDGFGAYAWCGRIDLAHKQAKKAREFYRVVEICEVTEVVS